MTGHDEIVAAIQRGDLASYADHHRHGGGALAEWAAAAHRACRRIAEQVDDARRELRTAAGELHLEPAHVRGAQQRHELLFTANREVARAAVERFRSIGYTPRLPDGAGGRRSFWATADDVTVIRSDDRTTVATIRWRTTAPSVLRRVLRPTAADWAVLDLPGPLWRLYPIVRVARVALERIGVRSRDHGAIEPFLVTPAGLVDPLLDVAGVDRDDVVADVGCGDGRLLVGAVVRHGCRAIGAEYDPALVAAARARAASAGVADLVEVVEGDGLTIPLAEVTVVLLFLPPDVLRRVLPQVLDRLPAGARVVAHEQAGLAEGVPAPDRSVPIVAADAVTVAHLWIAPASDTGN